MIHEIRKRFREGLERYADPHLHLMRSELRAFAQSLPPGHRVLDAGAGECQYKSLFAHCDYTSCDLAVGDAGWDYSNLDICCDLTSIPRADGFFQACFSVVVLEHVSDDYAVCRELWRVLGPGSRLFLSVPFCIQQHQMPHDYFRYTSSGVSHLLKKAGFQDIRIRAWGHDRLTLASWGANYCLLQGKTVVHRAFNKLLVAGWTGLKAYYLHHPRPCPDLPFGWIAEATK